MENKFNFIFSINNVETQFEVEGGTISIGRSSKCSISIDQSSVSKIHLYFQFKDNAIFYKDNNSSNGVIVNGKTCLADQWHEFNKGDTFFIAKDVEILEVTYLSIDSFVSMPFKRHDKTENVFVNSALVDSLDNKKEVIEEVIDIEDEEILEVVKDKLNSEFESVLEVDSDNKSESYVDEKLNVEVLAMVEAKLEVKEEPAFEKNPDIEEKSELEKYTKSEEVLEFRVDLEVEEELEFKVEIGIEEELEVEEELEFKVDLDFEEELDIKVEKELSDELIFDEALEFDEDIDLKVDIEDESELVIGPDSYVEEKLEAADDLDLIEELGPAESEMFSEENSSNVISITNYSQNNKTISTDNVDVNIGEDGDSFPPEFINSDSVSYYSKSSEAYDTLINNEAVSPSREVSLSEVEMSNQLREVARNDAISIRAMAHEEALVIHNNALAEIKEKEIKAQVEIQNNLTNSNNKVEMILKEAMEVINESKLESEAIEKKARLNAGQVYDEEILELKNEKNNILLDINKIKLEEGSRRIESGKLKELIDNSIRHLSELEKDNGELTHSETILVKKINDLENEKDCIQLKIENIKCKESDKGKELEELILIIDNKKKEASVIEKENGELIQSTISLTEKIDELNDEKNQLDEALINKVNSLDLSVKELEDKRDGLVDGVRSLELQTQDLSDHRASISDYIELLKVEIEDFRDRRGQVSQELKTLGFDLKTRKDEHKSELKALEESLLDIQNKCQSDIRHSAMLKDENLKVIGEKSTLEESVSLLEEKITSLEEEYNNKISTFDQDLKVFEEDYNKSKDEILASREKESDGLIEEASLKSETILAEANAKFEMLISSSKDNSESIILSANEKKDDIISSAKKKKEELDKTIVELSTIVESKRIDALEEVAKYDKLCLEHKHYLDDKEKEVIALANVQAEKIIIDANQAMKELIEETSLSTDSMKEEACSYKNEMMKDTLETVERELVLSKLKGDEYFQTKTLEADEFFTLRHQEGESYLETKTVEANALLKEALGSIEQERLVLEKEAQNLLDESLETQKIQRENILRIRNQANLDAKEALDHSLNEISKNKKDKCLEISDNINALFVSELRSLKNEEITLAGFQRILEETERIVRFSLINDSSIALDEKFKSIIKKRGNSEKRSRNFWLKAFSIFCLCVLLLYPLVSRNDFYSLFFNEVVQIFKSEKSSQDEFVKKIKLKRASVPRFKPSKSLGFKKTFSNNVIHTENFLHLYNSPSYQKKFTLHLEELFIIKWGLSEEQLVSYLNDESRHIRNLEKLLSKIKYAKQGKDVELLHVEEEIFKKKINKKYGNGLYMKILNVQETFFDTFIK